MEILVRIFNFLGVKVFVSQSFAQNLSCKSLKAWTDGQSLLSQCQCYALSGTLSGTNWCLICWESHQSQRQLDERLHLYRYLIILILITNNQRKWVRDTLAIDDNIKAKFFIKKLLHSKNFWIIWKTSTQSLNYVIIC